MTRNGVTATVISSEGFAVINEWINRGSAVVRCIDDTRESGVVSFTRGIHDGQTTGHICGIRAESLHVTPQARRFGGYRRNGGVNESRNTMIAMTIRFDAVYRRIMVSRVYFHFLFWILVAAIGRLWEKSYKLKLDIRVV